MDLKLIDMKRDQPDEESGPTAMPADLEGPQYPYGLNINLCDDELEKLGITELPTVGGEVHGMFAGMITSANQEPGDGERRLSIQIMYFAMEAEKPHPGEGKETAEDETRENSKPGMFRSLKKPVIIE